MRRPGEHGVQQRAQRRGLSLRKVRAGTGGAHPMNYWLVVPGASNVLVGGDAGLPLEEIVAWLSSSTQQESAAAFS